MMEQRSRLSIFVDEYLKDLNGTQAAIRAGYSAHSAREQAYQMLQREDVSAMIVAAAAERSKRTQIDADWVLRRLADEADADIADIYAEDGSLLPVKEWPAIWRKGLVTGLDVEEVREDGRVVAVIRKIRQSDRIKRIELIGKHVNVQAFKDRVEHTGKDGTAIQADVTIKAVLAAMEKVVDEC